MPSVAPVWTSNPGTMAYETARKRWAGTVSTMAADMERAAQSAQQSEKRREGEEISRKLAGLKESIQGNEALGPLPDEAGPDISGYNTTLQALSPISWHAAPWLFAECYLYRYVQTLFSLSQHWKDHDIFAVQKDSTFAKSRVAVEELATRYIQVVSTVSPGDANAEELLFEEMVQIALWGNATDLSLLSNLSLDEIQRLQGAEAIKKNQRNIVANDIEAVWAYISSDKPLRQVDIVLDNSGFEFFTDLVFALYLLKRQLASKIVFHVKDFPWFVSDVTPGDVDVILKDLGSHQLFPNRDAIDPLLQSLRAAYAEGSFSVRQNPFWTTGFSFHKLPTAEPALFDDLQKSDLVIFKGDLNYRKLTADGVWPYMTPFVTALGPLGQGSGVKILALRTNKADVCVGLANQEKVDALEKEAPGGAWVRNGKYAVVSFSLG